MRKNLSKQAKLQRFPSEQSLNALNKKRRNRKIKNKKLLRPIKLTLSLNQKSLLKNFMLMKSKQKLWICSNQSGSSNKSLKLKNFTVQVELMFKNTWINFLFIQHQVNLWIRWNFYISQENITAMLTPAPFIQASSPGLRRARSNNCMTAMY